MRLDTTTDHWCERLYEARAADFLLYGRALGLSHGEAEDVLQELFVDLLRLETAPREPLHYCLRSYRNRSLNYRRGIWRRLARELESSRWFERSDQVHPAEEPAMRSLRALPVEQREAIVLKIWHGYTFEEIGALLELSPNTVAGRYRYGLEKIRKSLREEAYEPTGCLGDTLAILESAPPV